MNYYGLDFHYHCHNEEEVWQIKRNPDFELGHGSYFLICAEDYVHDLAKKAGVEMQHAYSWPDGSLYKYIRAPSPLSEEDLKKKFLGSEPRTLTTPEGTSYIVTVSLKRATEEDGHQVHPTEYVSLHERWTLSREEIHKLYMHRHELREEYYKEYHHHRDTCPECPRPWGVACPEGNRLCTEAQAAAEMFISSLRSDK